MSDIDVTECLLWKFVLSLRGALCLFVEDILIFQFRILRPLKLGCNEIGGNSSAGGCNVRGTIEGVICEKDWGLGF